MDGDGTPKCSLLYTPDLIAVLVAKRVAANHDTAHRIHDIANLHIWSDASHRHDRVHRQRVAEAVIAVDGRRASRVLVLPYAEVVVDEGVVHPEDGVTGTG